MKQLRESLVCGFLICTLMGSTVLGCLSFNPQGYETGIYEGFGEGYRGPIRVRVRIGAEGILEIEIIEHGDDELVGGAAMGELAEAVLDSNSTNVDAIAGATESSLGFLGAIDDALRGRQRASQEQR